MFYNDQHKCCASGLEAVSTTFTFHLRRKHDLIRLLTWTPEGPDSQIDNLCTASSRPWHKTVWAHSWTHGLLDPPPPPRHMKGKTLCKWRTLHQGQHCVLASTWTPLWVHFMRGSLKLVRQDWLWREYRYMAYKAAEMLNIIAKAFDHAPLYMQDFVIRIAWCPT